MPKHPPEATAAPSDPAHLKQALRTRLKATRQALTDTRRRALDAQVCAHVLSAVLETPHPNHAIAMFVAHGGEPDLLPVAHRLIESGREVALPALKGDALTFHRYDPNVPMTANRFGIPEPVDQPRVAIETLDWVLMPLVGFSAAGARLGMGGGFYDRTLASVAASSPLKVGVGYAFQQVDALPVESWDVSMAMVVTDRGRLWVE